MKKLICFFLVILVLVSPALAADGSTLVYTTRTGECYHRYSCSCLSKSCYETTLAQAVANGYRPCGRCHPPTLDSGQSTYDRLMDEVEKTTGRSSRSYDSSSHSGYSSGSSSYRSYVPTHTPEEIKREKTIDLVVGLLVTFFVYPPLSFISWGLIIEGAKKIFKKKK